MKTMIFGFLLFSLAGAGVENPDPYRFIKNFEMVSIEVKGNKVLIRIRYLEVFGDTRFEFIPNNSCLESYPPRCFGTVARLDNQFEGERSVETTLEVNLDQAFSYGSPTTVTVAGPNKSFTFTY